MTHTHRLLLWAALLLGCLDIRIYTTKYLFNIWGQL